MRPDIIHPRLSVSVSSIKNNGNAWGPRAKNMFDEIYRRLRYFYLSELLARYTWKIKTQNYGVYFRQLHASDSNKSARIQKAQKDKKTYPKISRLLRNLFFSTAGVRTVPGTGTCFLFVFPSLLFFQLDPFFIFIKLERNRC